MPEITTRHTLFYDTKRPLRMWEIAEALLATEAVLQRSRPVLQDLFPDASIQTVEVLVEQLRSGSFYEDFVVKLLFGSQEELDGFIERTRQRARLDRMSDDQRILAAIFLSLLLIGGGEAIRRLASRPDPSNQIEINNTIIINKGADALEIAPERFRKAIEDATKKDRGKLANEAIRVLRPAKGSEAGSLVMDGNEDLSISARTIDAIPSMVFPDKPASYLQPFENVELEIRAIDLDKFKTGWAAIVPSIGKKRLPMEVAIDVDPASLAAGRTISGNITVVFEVGPDGQHKPRRLYLRELAPPLHVESMDSPRGIRVRQEEP